MTPEELIAFLLPVVGVVIVLLVLGWVKTLRVVRPSECHVVTKGKNVKVYDGAGKYNLLPILHRVQIIPKAIIEIESSKIKANDSELLPFTLEIACKIKVVEGHKAAESFGVFSEQKVRSFVEDTVFSATRSIAMTTDLLSLMKKRDEIESVIYHTTEEALAKIGIAVVLFDIKNIYDSENSSVLKDLERVKSVELSRNARIAEAQKTAEADVHVQKAIETRELARINQEMAVADKQRDLSMKRMEVAEIEAKRSAEIEKEKILIEAQAEADRVKVTAEGEAQASLIKAKALADGVRLKMEAEAAGTQKIAEALKSLDEAGMKIRMAEIQKESIIEASKSIAEALKENTKVFLPSTGSGNILQSLIPGIAAMQETGYDLGSVLGHKEKKEK